MDWIAPIINRVRLAVHNRVVTLDWVIASIHAISVLDFWFRWGLSSWVFHAFVACAFTDGVRYLLKPQVMPEVSGMQQTSELKKIFFYLLYKAVSDVVKGVRKIYIPLTLFLYIYGSTIRNFAFDCDACAIQTATISHWSQSDIYERFVYWQSVPNVTVQFGELQDGKIAWIKQSGRALYQGCSTHCSIYDLWSVFNQQMNTTHCLLDQLPVKVRRQTWKNFCRYFSGLFAIELNTLRAQLKSSQALFEYLNLPDPLILMWFHSPFWMVSSSWILPYFLYNVVFVFLFLMIGVWEIGWFYWRAWQAANRAARWEKVTAENLKNNESQLKAFINTLCIKSEGEFYTAPVVTKKGCVIEKPIEKPGAKTTQLATHFLLKKQIELLKGFNFEDDFKLENGKDAVEKISVEQLEQLIDLLKTESIEFQPLVDPVIPASPCTGHTYNRVSLQKWWGLRLTCPASARGLWGFDVVPDQAIIIQLKALGVI